MNIGVPPNPQQVAIAIAILQSTNYDLDDEAVKTLRTKAAQVALSALT